MLTRDQIDALPDDPDEMEAALKEMAGPGAMIRVDGFRGGKLPPKSQIAAIRFRRDTFAAENHGGGLVFVDITTIPEPDRSRHRRFHLSRRVAERAQRVLADAAPSSSRTTASR